VHYFVAHRFVADKVKVVLSTVFMLGIIVSSFKEAQLRRHR
jgi:hypothetical protein